MSKLLSKKRAALALLALMIPVIVVLASPTAQEALRQAGRSMRRSLLIATGRMVRVNGDTYVQFECFGQGSPTIVFQNGLGLTQDTWTEVAPAVAKTTRVCTYNRPGIGWSDRVPTPRTGQAITEEFHTILRNAEANPPYVLVGHSFGGILIRLYAAAYPSEVAGLVLVDSSQEDEYARQAALMDAETSAWYLKHEGGENWEGVDLLTTAEQVRQAPTPPDVPFVVLSGVLPGDYKEQAFLDLHDELQAKLVKLSPNARQVIAHNSGHFIQQDEPELVIEHILGVVTAARENASVR
jgi:pimeloyl-ACP methyl ester carboxylesterase